MKKHRLFWIPLALIIVHSTDEIITNFPDWATRHFGTTTMPFFVYTHILLLILVAAVSYLAWSGKHAAWKVLAATIQVQYAFNGLFHLFSSVIFKELTPGLATASLLSLPLTYVFFSRLIKTKSLTEKKIILSLICGLLLSVGIVASLWINGDWEWLL